MSADPTPEARKVLKEYYQLQLEIAAIHGGFHGGPQLDCKDSLCRAERDYRDGLVRGLSRER